MHPALSTLRNEIGAIMVRLMAYLGSIAVLAVIAADLLSGHSVDAAVEQVRPRAWAAAVRPQPAFSLPLAELADKSASYEILRHPDGGRRDILSWAAVMQDKPLASVEIYRPGSERSEFGPAISEIATLAGLTGVDGAQAAGVVATKFGAVPLVGFTTRHGAEMRACLGFAAPFEAPRLQISGWFCHSGSVQPARTTIVCALDRLTLLASGNDAGIAALFARAEMKRGACSATPVNDWMASLREPALRGAY